MKKTKSPFFAKFLETQKVEDNKDVKGGRFPITMKHPSDADDHMTMKWPSDGDEI